MGIVVPDIYMKFLNENKQRIFDDGILYDYEEILERYDTLEFEEYANNLIPIGNDNGDYELVMRADKGEKQFGIIDQGALGSVEPELWKDFDEWYSTGADFDFFPSVNISAPIAIASVFIKSLPEDDRVKVLMKIKKAFVLDMPISELLKLANNLPCVITDKYSRAQADGRIRDNDLQDWVSYK